MDGVGLSGRTPFEVSSLIQGMQLTLSPEDGGAASSSSAEASRPVVDIRLRTLSREQGSDRVDVVEKSLPRPVIDIQSPVSAKLVKV